MRNIGVNLCFLMLWHRGSMVLQGCRIMSAPGILWSTPPVHISGVRHWKARSLVWNLLFLLSGCPKVVWWWLLLRKPHSWALSLTASSVVSSLFTCDSLAFQTSVLLCLFLDLDTYGGVYHLGVFPLFQKKVADIIAPKLSIFLSTSVWDGFRSVGGRLM